VVSPKCSPAVVTAIGKLAHGHYYSLTSQDKHSAKFPRYKLRLGKEDED